MDILKIVKRWAEIDSIEKCISEAHISTEKYYNLMYNTHLKSFEEYKDKDKYVSLSVIVYSMLWFLDHNPIEINGKLKLKKSNLEGIFRNAVIKHYKEMGFNTFLKYTDKKDKNIKHVLIDKRYVEEYLSGFNYEFLGNRGMKYFRLRNNEKIIKIIELYLEGVENDKNRRQMV